MGEIEFIFQVKDYDAEALLPQVSRALKRRVELRSQQMRPGKPNPAEMTEQQRKKARTMDIVLGIVWLAVGIYFLVSGLGKGESNTWSLVIGVFAAFFGAKKLIPQRKPSSNTEKYDKAAREFMNEHRQTLDGNELQVCFSDEEMVIVTGAVEDLEQEAVTYGDVEFAMETEDIFLLVHNGRGVMLQKKDITLGSVEEFRDYLVCHLKSFVPYAPEAAEGTEQAAVPAAAEEAVQETQPDAMAEEIAGEADEETGEPEE